MVVEGWAAVASSLVVSATFGFAVPTAAIAQDEDPLEGLEFDLEEEEADEDGVVEIDSETYAEKLRGLFVPGESGVLAERQIEPEPRRLIRLGAVDLLPKWDQAVVDDDNVFLTRRDAKHDTIVRSTFGLAAETRFGGDDHRFVVGYNHERNYFTGGDAQNFVEHLASAVLQLNFNRFEIEVGDRFENRTDPVIAAFTGKIDRELNTTFARLRWSDPEWYFELRGLNTTIEYKDASFRVNDRDEQRATVLYGGPMNERSESFIQLSGVGRRFEHGGLNDMTGVVVSVGARTEVGDSLEFTGRIGVRRESYDDDFTTDTDDDETALEVELRAFWGAHKGGVLDFSYVRTTEFSPIGNFQGVDRGELQYSTGVAPGLRLQLGAAAELVSPSNATRFERYTGRAGLRFAVLDFVHLTLEYRRTFKTAAIGALKYDSNVAALGAEFRF